MNTDRVDKEEEEKIKQSNGRIVMSTLAFLNNDATAEELTQKIITLSGQPMKYVRHEVKRILDFGVTGFIKKIKNNYSLPGVYQTDSGKKCEAAEKFLENCLTKLEKLYPDFDYVNYIQARGGEEAEEEEEEGEGNTSDPPARERRSSDGESSAGAWSDTDLLDAEIGTRSRSAARRIAEFLGTKADETVICVDDSSSDEDDEVRVTPKAKKRLFADIDDESESPCELSPPAKKDRC